MTIEQLFKKDINRDIQGVIKIGKEEQENIQQELEEYVVTDELAKHFDTFFRSYKRAFQFPTDKVGVWISGFFGSGKSHFLKILSYLLNSGITADGKKPVTYFEEKIHNKETLHHMQEISKVPSEVVLFNIDSKTEADSKLNKEAIVRVFNKVFNEMRGFSASIPWLAQLEETLENNGEYESFKNAFEEETGFKWQDGRDELFYNMDETIVALSKGTNMSQESARKWIEDGEDNYSISVDSFAKRLKKYVDSKEDDFRLVFAADEVGQYISNNTQLMLNLQTVVENLGNYCHGKVWILVTSQQDIDSLRENISSTDFSKIQGRFNTRMSLSSANADEVIKIRLLEKREDSLESLMETFDGQETALKNKLEFDDNVPKGFRFYSNRENFAQVYPFVPYQFHLLQKVFTAIREHGSAGKHLSDGERNLLESVQQAIIQNKEETIGKLIPFYSFYAHIDQALEHSVRSTIIKAEQNEELSKFDVHVLKLLFLIRYVNEMPGTLKNMTTLMSSHIDEDTIELGKQINESVQLLEKEYYIQRIGNNYQFLTNEEQDVNREIGNITIPTSEVVNEAGKLLVDELLHLRRFTYHPFENKSQIQYLIDLSQWIDDRVLQNGTIDLGVRFLSVYSEISEEPEVLSLSQREPKVIVKLPDEYDFGELRHYQKINHYLREQSAKTKTDVIQEINHRKAQERTQILNTFKDKLKEAIEAAQIFVNGYEVEVTGQPIKRIEEGLRVLVESNYPKISYVVKNHSKEDLENLISNDQLNLIDERYVDDNRQATGEIERYLDSLHDRNMDSTILELIERYTKEPYGWKELDVLASLVHLIHAERVLFTINSRKMILSEENFLKQILKKNSQERIIVKKRKTIDSRVLSKARQLTKDLFAITALGEKEEEIALSIKDKFIQEVFKLEKVLASYRDKPYPEKTVVREALELVKKINEIKDSIDFLTYLSEHAEDISESLEDVEDVKSFFNSDQKQIYDKALQVQEQYKEDQHYLDNEELDYVAQQISDILEMTRPYAKIKDLEDRVSQFKLEYGQYMENVTAPIRERIEQDQEDILKILDEIDGFPEKEKLNTSYRFKMEDLEQKLVSARTVAKIRSFENESSEIKSSTIRQVEQAKFSIYKRQEEERKQSDKEQKQKETISKDPVNKHEKIYPTKSIVDPPIVKDPPRLEKSYIAKRTEIIPREMIMLRNEEDIDNFVDDIRRQLLKELGKVDYIRIT